MGSKATKYFLDILLLEFKGDWRKWDIANHEWSGGSNRCLRKTMPRSRSVCSGAGVVVQSITRP